MKIKNLKFEDIAYYADNMQPFLKSKMKQLNESVIVVQNPKRFTFITINVILFFIYCYLVISMNYSMNCSMTANLIVSILILLIAIYLNSKILYAFNHREKTINDVVIEENYIKKFKFNSALVDKIKEIKSDLNLNGKTDIAILFLYVQHFVLKQRISNSEIIRQINGLFEFEQFSEAHYSKTANNLFEWKDEKEKIKTVNNVSKYSSHYQKFNEIAENLNDFRR